MVPWIWWWAPTLHLHLPLGGDVLQDIDPTLSWFFGEIPPEAGDGRIERRAFEVASYGRQIGWITEVLIELARRGGLEDGVAGDSLRKLQDIRAEIETIKDAEYEAQAGELVQAVERIRRLGGPRTRALARRLAATQR